MTDDQIIDQIEHSFKKYALQDIQAISRLNSHLDFTIAEFILCSCLIDQVSGFRYNSGKVGKRYKRFVDDYLPNYNSGHLWDDLRNKLVHQYSVGSFYALTRRLDPSLHLQPANGIVYLNLENFIEDLSNAIDTYISELRNNEDIRRNALSWFADSKIISQVS